MIHIRYGSSAGLDYHPARVGQMETPLTVFKPTRQRRYMCFVFVHYKAAFSGGLPGGLYNLIRLLKCPYNKKRIVHIPFQIFYAGPVLERMIYVVCKHSRFGLARFNSQRHTNGAESIEQIISKLP